MKKINNWKWLVSLTILFSFISIILLIVGQMTDILRAEENQNIKISSDTEVKIMRNNQKRLRAHDDFPVVPGSEIGMTQNPFFTEWQEDIESLDYGAPLDWEFYQSGETAGARYLETQEILPNSTFRGDIYKSGTGGATSRLLWTQVPSGGLAFTSHDVSTMVGLGQQMKASQELGNVFLWSGSVGRYNYPVDLLEGLYKIRFPSQEDWSANKIEDATAVATELYTGKNITDNTVVGGMTPRAGQTIKLEDNSMQNFLQIYNFSDDTWAKKNNGLPYYNNILNARFRVEPNTNVANYRKIRDGVVLKSLIGFQAGMVAEERLQLEVPLGKNFSESYQAADIETMIKDKVENIKVYYGDYRDKPLTEIDGAVESLKLDGIVGELPDTSYISEDTPVLFQITAMIDGNEVKGAVPASLAVVWGNTISLGDSAGEDSAIALSLLEIGGKYEIAVTYGDGFANQATSLNTSDISSENDIFFQVDIFSKEVKEIDTSLKSNGYLNIVGEDTFTPLELVEHFGIQQVELGDIIRVYMTIPGHERWFTDSDLVTPGAGTLPMGTWVYYRVTDHGFERMNDNQLSAKQNIEIAKNTPDTWFSSQDVNSYLIKDESLDYAGISYSGTLIKLPDTNEVGNDKQGTLSVTAITEDPELTISFNLFPTSNVTEEEFENWLPYYSKWLNSETKTIPKKNAFVMMRSSKTEIVESETSPEIWDNYQNKVLGVINADGETLDNTVAYPTNKEQHITFSNVGYYNGESVNVTVSIKPDKAAPDDSKHYSYIGLDGKNAAGDDLFLDISLDKLSEAADINFQFKNSEGKSIEISGYWTFSNINDVKDVVLPISEIKNIYSISREYEQAGEKYPVMLKYEELATSSWGEKALKLSGVGYKLPNQIRATVTYDKQSSFKYRMVYKDKSESGFDVKYIQGSDAKVEIPDPQGLDQSFDIITAENYPKNDQSNEIEKPLNYQFIQPIPYESERNRNQTMEWSLPVNSNESITELTEWKIINEAGLDGSHYFTIDAASEKILPTQEAYEDEKFYNHYYFFQKNLMINTGVEIDPKILNPLDNKGQYLDYTGEIGLQVTDADRTIPFVTDAFHSYINFEAAAVFQPVYRDGENQDQIKPIPGVEPQIESNLLITHKYKAIKPPEIAGYEYADESIPDNYTALPVCYTNEEDNRVQLVYEGKLMFSIPEDMDFQKVSVPNFLKKTEYLQTINPNWEILVSDTRPAAQRTQYKLSAQLMNQSFDEAQQTREYETKANEDGDVYTENIPLLSNVLRFANSPGEINDLTQSVQIYDSTATPSNEVSYPIQWEQKNTGFFLDLQAYHYYPLGKYKATIDFTVEYGME